MMQFFQKPRRWALVFSLLLIGAFAGVLCDTFVIPRSLTAVVTKTAAESLAPSQSTALAASADQARADAVVTGSSYEDENIKINIETVRDYGTTIYVADIQLVDVSLLKTALADNTYGRNIKQATSEMAAANNAILAINGDYYGFRNDGCVLRNGVLYRDTARNDSDAQDLVIDADGGFSIIPESQASLDALDTDNIWQVFSFGPALIEDSQVVVDSASEVDQSMNSNPRTAIGQTEEGHYIIIVADGRTSESDGLSLLELAREFEQRGCTTAYNLDGGGSSTMYFNGQIVNQPTDGRSRGEREVSDIVYIGY